jgi:hypothetical protein
MKKWSCHSVASPSEIQHVASHPMGGDRKFIALCGNGSMDLTKLYSIRRESRYENESDILISCEEAPI